MTEDPLERQPLTWRQDMENIHPRLNPSVESAQVTAELKHMAKRICKTTGRGQPRDKQRDVQQAQIMDEEWVA